MIQPSEGGHGLSVLRRCCGDFTPERLPAVRPHTAPVPSHAERQRLQARRAAFAPGPGGETLAIYQIVLNCRPGNQAICALDASCAVIDRPGIKAALPICYASVFCDPARVTMQGGAFCKV